MRRVISLLFAAVAVAVAPAQAQNEEIPHLLPVEVNVGGGYTFSLSGVRQFLGDGYHVNAGATLKPNSVVGLQVEFSYTSLGSRTVDVRGTVPEGAVRVPVTASMHMLHANANLVVRPRTGGRAKPYLIGGVGVYRRPVEVTTSKPGYVPGYCSPYYYVCWPGSAVSVDQTLVSANTTGFGVDVGGGIFVLMGKEAGGGFYIESRYHYIWGPELTDQGTSYGKANGQFLPITVGLRF